MMFRIGRLLAVAVAAAAAALPISARVAAAENVAVAVDSEAAETLARRESCLKCHAIDKRKDGPSYRQVAAKYKGDPGAEEQLIRHVKAGEIVKMRNGDEEEHRVIQSKDEDAIRNLVRWILVQ